MKRLPVTFLAILLGLFSLPQDSAARKKEPEPPQINFAEIQTGVMSFADSWLALVGQGYITLLAEADDPQTRLALLQMRLSSLSGAVDIAAGPYSGIALLDMMVFASLQRATWDRHWQPKFPMTKSQLSDSHQQLEEKIWAFGANYLSPDQQAEVRSLIDQWLDRNPEAFSAGFIRFSDFGSLGRSPGIQRETRPGGLLAPVREAAAAADAIQESLERIMFMIFRMQNLMAQRAELSVANILAGDEFSQLLEDVSGFRQVAEDYSVIIDGLAEELERVVAASIIEFGKEREAAITQAMTEISQEREAAITQLMVAIGQEREDALNQVLDGIQAERSEMMGLVLHVVLWADLQAKAMFARIFVLSACLILLYFLLRLVYRYMREKENFNFRSAVGTIALLWVTAISIIAIGVVFVEFSKPDIRRIKAMEQELKAEQALQLDSTQDAEER